MREHFQSTQTIITPKLMNKTFPAYCCFYLLFVCLFVCVFFRVFFFYYFGHESFNLQHFNGIFLTLFLLIAPPSPTFILSNSSFQQICFPCHSFLLSLLYFSLSMHLSFFLSFRHCFSLPLSFFLSISILFIYSFTYLSCFILFYFSFVGLSLFIYLFIFLSLSYFIFLSF